MPISERQYCTAPFCSNKEIERDRVLFRSLLLIQKVRWDSNQDLNNGHCFKRHSRRSRHGQFIGKAQNVAGFHVILYTGDSNRMAKIFAWKESMVLKPRIIQ